MNWKEFSVKVPASTANLGPGFDSIGLALDLYLTIHASPSNDWLVEYKDKNHQHLPLDKENLLISTALKVAEQYNCKLPCARLTVSTDIPLGKGLGSSASAIAAGIEIADRLGNLNLSMKEKLIIGTEMEGHPDNITASMLGGLTISYFDEEIFETVHIADVSIGVLLLIPEKELLTAESRGLLPFKMKHSEAVKSSAASNVLAASLTRGDWQTAGRLMEKDQFHEYFRKNLFPDFEEIRRLCREAGAYGCAISGAGPSLFITVPPGTEADVAFTLLTRFPHYECMVTKPAISGMKLCETVV